ncbi:MAG TPA: NADH-quinone oxidoreductase subunit H [Thermoanaerobacterales bacterium]|nr:NADH-quinone oxidoreductase subunit H [Thermoanaerobacterales bacterium]
MITKVLAAAFFSVIISTLAGGILTGLDRKLTALMQGRCGPPVWQPFFDIVKLFSKEPMVVNDFQVLAAFAYLFSEILAVALFALKTDLLMIVFIMSIGSVFYIVGAMAVRSPYSQVGAQRELFQMVVYEPLLMLVLVGIYFETGSFNISGIMEREPLIIQLPLFFLVLSLVLDIKMKKSPFDFSASEHAHQELVRGIQTDYSGPYLAMVEMAHWYELVVILAMLALFLASHVVLGILLSMLVFFAEIVIDNITARMTLKWMVGFSWCAGILLTFSNLAYIYIRR